MSAAPKARTAARCRPALHLITGVTLFTANLRLCAPQLLHTVRLEHSVTVLAEHRVLLTPFLSHKIKTVDKVLVSFSHCNSF